MNVDGIIFDKDGTLIDFEAFWNPVSLEALRVVLKQLGREDALTYEILEAFGVHDGIVDINGVLCKGTYRQMARIVYEIVSPYGCEVSCNELERMVIAAYNKSTDKGDIKPTVPNLLEILTELKKREMKLAIVTTDNEEITRKCLKKLGIEELFDKIYTDDGKFPSKPEPCCIFDFCNYVGVAKERVVMVGDTMTDVVFAKNAGISVIGVAKTNQNKQILAPHADAVITDLSHIFEVLG